MCIQHSENCWKISSLLFCSQFLLLSRLWVANFKSLWKRNKLRSLLTCKNIGIPKESLHFHLKEWPMQILKKGYCNGQRNKSKFGALAKSLELFILNRLSIWRKWVTLQLSICITILSIWILTKRFLECKSKFWIWQTTC